MMAYRVAFGDNVDYIDARYQRITLKPIVWIALNQTGVSSTEFINRGWNPVTTTAVTGWLVFYRVIEPVRSTQTALGSLSLPVRVDASSLPTNARIRFLVWIADLQNEDAARSGVGTTSLPAYGGYSGYGLTSPLGFAFQSSGGSPTNPLLAAV
ncbi:MAG: hypothetical protein RMJ28_07775, partial [Nitrososphaerota archaeon]|nr:hypothetical protein [Nitrososphaerota archaeon]